MTVLAKLVAKSEDISGYITYVFKCLELDEYVMCTRFPNWDHRVIKIGEIGYLNFYEIRAGIDQWFDGEKMVPYRYNNIQFDRFIEKKEDNNEFTI